MEKHVLYLAFAFLIFLGKAGSARTDSTYTIFPTGNLFGKVSNTSLLDKWEEETQKADNLAILLNGNAVDGQSGKFPVDLATSKNHPILIAPGRTEWGDGSRSGKEFMKNLQGKLAESLENPLFMPDHACPGPVEVELSDYLVVILVDTWWWVHKYDRRFAKCGIETSSDVLIEIEDAIRRHHGSKHVVIAGYHSLKSYGNSGGYFSAAEWLMHFPYAFIRKFPGTRYDSRHPDLKGFRDGMLAVLKEYPDVLYVSSGESNLQYFAQDNAHFVISGSFQNSGYVKKEIPGFSSEENGFAQITFSSQGKCDLIFHNKSEPLFAKEIYNKNFIETDHKTTEIPAFPDSITTIASNRYNISEKGYAWLGKNYRDVWATPVKVPVFDIGKEKGGLSIVKRGGGQQTFSLRLKDKDGKQYVLRSIDKYVEGAVPADMHATFAVDLVQDQISASNPYAAKVVSALAGYAGVFHTHPEVVYVPDDQRFGIYRQDVADKLFLFEERPQGNRNDMESFGFPENIVSTAEVVEKTARSAKYSFDKNAVLRARLFDIIINDWDRHDDQWRWSEFEEAAQTTYKPIPRDRDQAFFVNQGILPRIASRKWLLPKIQGFTEISQNMDGQSFNARWFDRTFLVQNSWDDWLLQIDTLRNLLMPEKIDEAVQQFPAEIYPLSSPETARILKARLENLTQMARELYLSLAKEVAATGTSKADLFEIFVLTDSTVQITAYELLADNQQGKQFYQRTFHSSETSKINIYGFDGDDKFLFSGNNRLKTELKIIDAAGDNEVIAENFSGSQKVIIYDKKDAAISPALQLRLKTNFDNEALKYDREHFEYDVVFPGIFSGYNPDDGLILGGGPIFKKYSRYVQQQYSVLGNIAPATGAVNFQLGIWRNFPIRRVEINSLIKYNSPSYAGNFFGMGNEARWDVPYSEKEYYRLRMHRFYSELDFVKWLDAGRLHKAGPGLLYGFADAEKNAARFISQPGNGLRDSDLEPHSWTGLYFKYEFNSLGRQVSKSEFDFAGSSTFQTRGMQFSSRAGYYAGLNQPTGNFLKLSADWQGYLSFSQRPRFVYVLRAGGQKVSGDYPFHQAATLGRTQFLRGYRETRFFGDASAYINAEVRIRLKQFNSYLLNGTAGALLFNDTGRVWLQNENSQKWHNGTGVGFWLSPFNMAVVSVSYAVSPDDRLFNFAMSYQF